MMSETVEALEGETRPARFEIRDEEIDVARLMERIERNVAEKRKRGVYGEEPWLDGALASSRRGASGVDLGSRLSMLKMAARIDLEGEPIASHRRFTGSFVVWLKRWTRFWIRRYTDSIFYKQNHYNAETTDVLIELRGEIDELRREVKRLEKGGSENSPPSP